jgi:hypothetical protein
VSTVRTTLALSALAVVLGGGAVHPFGAVEEKKKAPLLSGASIDAADLARIQRSCGNCHSDHVQWPLYSYVAPVSWMLERDVNQARTHLNLSHWPAYTPQEQITLLSTIGAVLRNNAMPPQRYTVVHRAAALSSAERDALYEWSKQERRRLRALSAKN